MMVLSQLGRAVYPVHRWLEPLLGFAVAAAFVRALLFLYWYGYLPQPYFYDPTDTWMDWFNTAFWAHDNGVYDTWKTIYPPLSFVFLRIFSKSSCYGSYEDLFSRDCDWVGVATLFGFWLLNAILITLTFLKVDRKTAIPRSLALALGLPMTLGLDRGNLVIVCFTFVLLGFGPLLRSARLRWLAVGFAINFKVYLIAALFPQLLRRRWRWFEGALISVIFVYLASYSILGRGTPIEIYNNIVDFSGVYQAIGFLDLWYAGSLTPLTSLLNGSQFPIVQTLGSSLVENLNLLLPALLHVVQATIMVAALAAWLRPEVVPMFRLTQFAIAFALITAEAGGYTQTMILLFVLMEKWEGFGRKWAIIGAYILCLPLDITLFRLPPLSIEGYLSGRPIVVEYAVTLGPFLRPLLIMSLPFALSCVTIRAVWKDVREQGWKTRWRFRRDLPIMVGEGHASAPGQADSKA